MMNVFFKAVPFSKEAVTLALESGVDGIFTDAEHVEGIRRLARCEVVDAASCCTLALHTKADEEAAAARLALGESVILARGWEVIPVENLLAVAPGAPLALEVASPDEARLASGILERGVSALVLLPETLPVLKEIVAEVHLHQPPLTLTTAKVTAVRHAGLGHRVCVDTLSLFERGQGMLVGHSSAFMFLVHAETEHNEYVAARPFRVNAGGVHGYVLIPDDKTCYTGELRAGSEVMAVRADGSAERATVGRVKIEVRPMLMITAETSQASGTLFLQNAETIRLTRPEGVPVSVVELRPGDEILCKTDTAGRHFGMRIQENIIEA